ncbi:MAG: aldo/keto reductase [Acidobacteria bacterium]|nr:aldo/keto reductase [Acidobacteriota bacterium]
MISVSRVQLAGGYTIPRLVTGAWQLSAGHAIEPLERDAVLASFTALVDHGFTAFDCADIYTGVEELLGEFLAGLPVETRGRVQVHTKFVPDRDALARVDRRYVETIIDRSLARLGVERLDLVQFSWWDYGVPGYVDVAGYLAELRRAGKIRLLGATNLDVVRLAEIVDAGVPMVSNQVQYSLLDARPEEGMVAFCKKRGMALLCYGALAGGFLSKAWVGAAGPPDHPANRSLIKYGLIIEEFGGWALYQELLEALSGIADKHGVSIATVALRWVVDRPAVAAPIVGISRSDRTADNLAAFSLALDDDDRRDIDAVLSRRSGPPGDVFGLEREPGGKHAAIMRYNLNQEDAVGGS